MADDLHSHLFISKCISNCHTRHLTEGKRDAEQWKNKAKKKKEVEKNTLINAIADKFLQIDISCTIQSGRRSLCRILVHKYFNRHIVTHCTLAALVQKLATSEKAFLFCLCLCLSIFSPFYFFHMHVRGEILDDNDFSLVFFLQFSIFWGKCRYNVKKVVEYARKEIIEWNERKDKNKHVNNVAMLHAPRSMHCSWQI